MDTETQNIDRSYLQIKGSELEGTKYCHFETQLFFVLKPSGPSKLVQSLVDNVHLGLSGSIKRLLISLKNVLRTLYVAKNVLRTFRR